MLDKKHSKTWVKTVAWGLAIVFGLSALLFVLPARQPNPDAQNNLPAKAPVSQQTIDPKAAAQALAGQAEQAVKNGDFDQAINFYDQAQALDQDNAGLKTSLADVYYEKGKALQANDATASTEAFNKYLELLPSGPKAAEVSGLLADLN
jgi:Flp pilus assembly protein TadD